MGSDLLSNILKHRTAWHRHTVENDDDNDDDNDDENDDDVDYDCGGKSGDLKRIKATQ